MKVSKENYSLRALHAEALYGKGAGHPLCLAWLGCKKLQRELSAAAEHLAACEATLDQATRQREQANNLHIAFRDSDRIKEAWDAAKMYRAADAAQKKSADLVTRAQHYIVILTGAFRYATANFERQCDKVQRDGDTKAVATLDKVKKHYALSLPHKSTALYVLNLVQRTAIKRAWRTIRAVVGYHVAAFGPDCAIMEFAGLLSAQDIQDNIVPINSPKAARRIAAQLGLELIKEEPGKKIAELPKAKRPRGRPATNLVAGITFMGNLAEVADKQAKLDDLGGGYKNLAIYRDSDSSEIAGARRVLKAIDREIRKIRMERGGRKGNYVY